MSDPECNETGCICRWSWSLSDEALIIAFGCLQREYCRRVGIPYETLIKAASNTMDPQISDIQAKATNRFVKNGQA